MARKCAICGLKFELEDDLLQARDSSEIYYCPSCREKKSAHLGVSFLIACPIVLVGGFLWVLACPQNEFAWIAFQAGLFLCFLTIVALPHELGHVLVALAVRAKVSKVTIGLGGILFKRKFIGTEWEFCAIPICGLTYVAVGDRYFYRIRNFFVSSGGPLVNCLFGIASLIVLFFISSPWIVSIAKAFLFANIFAFLYSLLPRKVNVGGISTLSDGLRLLSLPFMSKSEIDREIAGIK